MSDIGLTKRESHFYRSFDCTCSQQCFNKMLRMADTEGFLEAVDSIEDAIASGDNSKLIRAGGYSCSEIHQKRLIMCQACHSLVPYLSLSWLSYWAKEWAECLGCPPQHYSECREEAEDWLYARGAPISSGVSMMEATLWLAIAESQKEME